MIPIGGEVFGGQVPQIVGLRRGPERAHSSMGERGPQTRGPREIEDFVGWEMQGREMGCMGAEDPLAIRNQSSWRYLGGRSLLSIQAPPDARLNVPDLRWFAESSISIASRFLRVASCLGLTTHQMHTRR